MNKYFAAAFAAFSMVAAPAAAQDRMTTQTCTDGWAAVETLAGLPASGPAIEADAEGWCFVDDLEFDFNDQQTYRLRSLRWRASGVDRLINEGLPPRTLEIVAKGFSIVAKTGDPVFDYLLGLQSDIANTGFGLIARWDGVQNAILLDDAYVDFFPGNRIAASARIDNVNLTDMATIQSSIGTMGLRDMTITADFAGWFETYVALALGTQVLTSDGPPPEAQVEALQAQALALIEAIPAAIMPDASRAALGGFVQSLPTPRGSLRLQVSANPPLGAARMAPFAVMPEPPTPEQVIELGLEGVAVLFNWTPTGE